MVRYCIDDDIKSIFSRQTGCLENSAPYNINRNPNSATYTFFKNSTYVAEQIRTANLILPLGAHGHPNLFRYVHKNPNFFRCVNFVRRGRN